MMTNYYNDKYTIYKDVSILKRLKQSNLRKYIVIDAGQLVIGLVFGLVMVI